MGEQRKIARQSTRRDVRRRIGNILWNIYKNDEERERLRNLKPLEWVGTIERWVDKVHYEDGDEGRTTYAMTTAVTTRILHAMKCMITYVRMVVRPALRVKELEVREEARLRHAKWRICALLVREYKQRKQTQMLEDRSKAREGLVCAHTRNVGRLAPKGGVVYDETRRNKARIQVGDMYTLRRWPRRDKCGPTLVNVLHHLWGIT